MSSTALSYFFTAVFNDGSTIHQTADDISATDPARSQFFDVAQRIDDVRVFALTNANGDVIAVDLHTGLFASNGLVFAAGDPRIQPPQDTEYRLIYFRRHTHRFNAQLEELDHEVEYVIGWQATVNGENVQQTLVLR
jgi:hypothetical protein